ncbi:MAG: toprim domain-containing protein [Chloroflexi bacterium]|nr:toprim domain-containing protein [Chloroflexota bacterium]
MFDTEAIRAAHPIADAVEGAGVSLRRSGPRLVGLCPFHDDRRPSLLVYPSTSSWFCFACDVGGDVIDFVGRIRGTGFRETAELLAGPAGSRARRAAAGGGAPPPAVRTLDAHEAAVIEAAASLYAGQYRRSRSARSYLRGRGIGEETAARLRVGLASGGLARRLRGRDGWLDAARRLGLLSGERDTLAGRVVIPDLDARGRATWLTARALGEEEPRYLNLRLPSPLLGLERARAQGAAACLLTEGPFDWLTAGEWGIRAVALLGTHLSRDALAALRSFRRVYVALDSDGPGRRASARIRSELGARATAVPLPGGVHDLSELGRRAGGRSRFLRSLQQAHQGRQDACPTSTQHGRRARAA